jgi:hypothetical protein
LTAMVAVGMVSVVPAAIGAVTGVTDAEPPVEPAAGLEVETVGADAEAAEAGIGAGLAAAAAGGTEVATGTETGAVEAATAGVDVWVAAADNCCATAVVSGAADARTDDLGGLDVVVLFWGGLGGASAGNCHHSLQPRLTT